MNGASKILTVSYGTFSCTLEGFDDPFNTMKAIAEYFRDLAAGDRYFGAEPPTPDAAMLHQIAEREIQRRVEAKIQENGVVLRASEQGAEAAVPQVAAAPVAEAPAPRVTIPAVAVEAAAPAVVPTVEPVAMPAAESVVEKLSRLRSEIAAQPVAAPALTVPVVSLAIPEYVEDQETETPSAAALADFLPEDMVDATADLPEAALAAVTEDAPDADAGVVDAPVAYEAEENAEAFVAEVAAAAGDEDAVIAPVMAEEDALLAEVDLAAVMDEVAAPAEVAEAEPAAEGDLPDTLRAVLDAVPQDDAVSDAEVALSEALAVDAFETPYEDAPAEDFDVEAMRAEDALAEIAVSEDVAYGAMEEADGRLDAAAEAAEPVAAEDSVSIWAETEQDDGDALRDDLPVVEDVLADAAEPALLPEASGAEEAAPVVAEAAGEPTPGIELRPGAAEKLQRARARVIRIRKGDDAPAAATELAAPVAVVPEVVVPEPVVPDVTLPEVAEVDLTPVMGAETEEAPMGPLLSPEDEAELQRELAALRRSEEERDAAEAAALAHQSEGRRVFDGPSADEALGRLMQQTASEMEGTETKRRQSAIQHLKAAVAATVADRKVAGDKAGESETVSRLARYRNDLAMAVKAALPGRGGSTVPQGERPAPLVLVSEQRIDRPRPTSAPAPVAAPIRPRRVTSAGLGMTAAAAGMDLSDEDEEDDDLSNVFDDSKGFVEFVERVGANGFEQILEASAAYIAGVEGRPHFSRPQLMRHLTAVIPQGSFQREDGLRSFGTLLRDGRIAKVRRGQFTLTEESAYLAEARKLAQ